MKPRPVSTSDSSPKTFACDYCGKPAKMWVGIKRTCFDIRCRKIAKKQQLQGPKVNLQKAIEMISEEEHRRSN